MLLYCFITLYSTGYVKVAPSRWLSITLLKLIPRDLITCLFGWKTHSNQNDFFVASLGMSTPLSGLLPINTYDNLLWHHDIQIKYLKRVLELNCKRFQNQSTKLFLWLFTYMQSVVTSYFLSFPLSIMICSSLWERSCDAYVAESSYGTGVYE